MTTPRELNELYKNGVNITELLRKEEQLDRNTDRIIEIAYDLQTGSYIAAMERPEMAAYIEKYTEEIVKVLLSLGPPVSILEAGVGEATTLSGVMQKLGSGVDGFGFDLSWSRVAYGRRWLESKGLPAVTLCTGNLFQIPFADNSIDVVYTSHSIEPNGGNEIPILKELYRVAGRYLVLLEPGYELAGEDARKRMESHGYCKNLKGVAETLGYQVVDHRLFPVTVNPLNPTAITIIRKNLQFKTPSNVFVCPQFKTALKEKGGMLFSPEALVVYPIIAGIPCLRVENGIFASKYCDVLEGGG
jgi:uncharacterized protein YbaR (Trm112 family)